ncbi:unnamed protein product [Calicophoron daubneyi]|uniref:DUF4604 domain-containing protein n=1 Tax=Calicophoron daubneyi TaxID=300641 RepID=A0AAV2TQW3_CALDB
MPRKAKVEYIQHEEPSFIRKFKQRAGIPDADTVESKRATRPPNGDDECGDRADEQPQIVLDPHSGVTESEARAFLTQNVLPEKKSSSRNEKKSDNQGTTEPGEGKSAHSTEAKILFRSAAQRRKVNTGEQLDHSPDLSDRSRQHVRGDQKERDRSPLGGNHVTAKEAVQKTAGFLSFNADEEDD